MGHGQHPDSVVQEHGAQRLALAPNNDLARAIGAVLPRACGLAAVRALVLTVEPFGQIIGTPAGHPRADTHLFCIVSRARLSG